MKLIITRHGETEENKKKIIQGHLHGTLSDLGKEQARKLAERLKDEKIDLILSSDLARAKDTATEIAKLHPNVPFELDERLRERFLGNFQGKTPNEKWGEIKWDEELSKEAGIETISEMNKRVKSILDKLNSKYNDKNVLLVGHHGINLTIINYLLGKDPQDIGKLGSLKNTSINIFEFNKDGKPKLKLFNCTKHLD